MSCPFLTAPQAEAFLGVPTARTYRWRERGQLVVKSKIGRHEMFDPGDLLALNLKADTDKRSAKYV